MLVALGFSSLAQLQWLFGASAIALWHSSCNKVLAQQQYVFGAAAIVNEQQYATVIKRVVR